MSRIRAFAAVFALTPLLAACALFKPSLRADVKIKIPEEYSGEQYGAEQIVLGRQKLDEGLYGQAIVALSNARHYPEHAAAAYNGLAIAYSQIGRLDLAERYFKQAMAEAPGDARYQANLNRFYQSLPAVAVRSERSNQLASAPRSPLRPQAMVRSPGNAVIRIELPAARTVRVSSNEVRIETAPPVDVRRRSPRNQMALVVPTARPVIRRNSDYPVRIHLKVTQ